MELKGSVNPPPFVWSKLREVILEHISNKKKSAFTVNISRRAPITDITL